MLSLNYLFNVNVTELFHYYENQFEIVVLKAFLYDKCSIIVMGFSLKNLLSKKNILYVFITKSHAAS